MNIILFCSILFTFFRLFVAQGGITEGITRFVEKLFDIEKLPDDDDERTRQLKIQMKERIAKNETDLLAKKLNIYDKCRKSLEIVLINFRLEIYDLIDQINDLREKIGKEKDDEIRDQIKIEEKEKWKELSRIDSQIYFYRKAAQRLDKSGKLHIKSFRDLKEPKYANALINFIMEGADFCTGITVGQLVEFPDMKEQHYNFFEELIEELADTKSPEKVVKRLKFVLEKKEQTRDYEALLGPNGVLTKEGVFLKGGEIGVDGKIKLSSEQSFKRLLLLQTEYQDEYELFNHKNPEGIFDVKLKYAEGMLTTPKKSGEKQNKPKLLSLEIRRRILVEDKRDEEETETEMDGTDTEVDSEFDETESTISSSSISSTSSSSRQGSKPKLSRLKAFSKATIDDELDQWLVGRTKNLR